MAIDLSSRISLCSIMIQLAFVRKTAEFGTVDEFGFRRVALLPFQIKSLLVCATFRCRFETSEATFCEDVTFDVIALPRSILGRRTDKEIKEGEGQKKSFLP